MNRSARHMVSDWYEVQLAQARKYLDSYLRSFDPEDLHQLRVAIKKLRAVIVLVEFVSGDPAIRKIHKKIKLLFRQAGGIRELQLHYQWLRQRRKIQIIRNLDLSPQIDTLQQDFNRACVKIDRILTQADKRLRPHLGMLTALHVHRFLEHLSAESTILLSESKNPGNWHELRKRIKKLLYGRHWATETYKKRRPFLQHVKALDHLQECIGAWHDLLVLETFVADRQASLNKGAIVQRQYRQTLNSIAADKTAVAQKVIHSMAYARQKCCLPRQH